MRSCRCSVSRSAPDARCSFPQPRSSRLRLWSDDDRHGLTSPQRNRDAIDADRDGVAAEQTFMQDFDRSTLDETEFDQSAFKIFGGLTGHAVTRLNCLDAALESQVHGTQGACRWRVYTVFVVDHGQRQPWRMSPLWRLGWSRSTGSTKKHLRIGVEFMRCLPAGLSTHIGCGWAALSTRLQVRIASIAALRCDELADRRGKLWPPLDPGWPGMGHALEQHELHIGP